MTVTRNQGVASPKEVMGESLKFLRECARRALVEKDDTVILTQDLKEARMREFMAIGNSFELTERDMVVLLYKSIFDNHEGADAYLNRGTDCSNLGQYQRAIKDYNQAIRIDPQNAGAYINRGVAYLNLSQPEQAIKDFDEAIVVDPQFANAYLNRALAYTLLGKGKEAEQDVDRAVRLGLDRGMLDAAIEALKNQR